MSTNPGNLTGKYLTPEVKEIERSGFLQNDRLSKTFLAPQEPNWKPLASRVIFKKLVFGNAQHC